MDPELLPFIKFSEADASREAPQIRLDIGIYQLYHASTELSITLPIRIDIILRREQDSFEQACVFVLFDYIAFKFTRFLLLHQKGDSFEQVNVGQGTFENRGGEDIMKVDGYDNGLEELRPGEARRFVQILQDNLHKALIPGERYRLIWPGEEIFMWDWGTKRDWVGKELKSQAARESKLPRLILPSSAGVEFTVKEESEPWPGRAEYEAEFGFSAANSREADWLLEQNPPRSPSPISPSQRGPEAPVLTVTLEGDGSHMTRNGDFFVTSRVTYEKPVDPSEETKPIIFHIWVFDYCYRLYRLREGKWERCETEDTESTGFLLVDNPDERIKVSEHKDFVSLRPGESWTTRQTVQKRNYTWIPDDSVVGDTFRFIFKGYTLDWWDWGDGTGTEVTLPCFHWARVIEPADNDGRPDLVVPGSNTVEFSIVEE